MATSALFPKISFASILALIFGGEISHLWSLVENWRQESHGHHERKFLQKTFDLIKFQF
jgi:hypothetical protein